MFKLILSLHIPSKMLSDAFLSSEIRMYIQQYIQVTNLFCPVLKC